MTGRSGVRTGVVSTVIGKLGMLWGGCVLAVGRFRVESGGCGSVPMGLQNRYSPVRFRPAPLCSATTSNAPIDRPLTLVRESVRESSTDRFFSDPRQALTAGRLWL